RLIGGVYGVVMGKVFFGESMFSRESGASKIIFAELAPRLFARGIQLIDCQMHTEHLARFGAYMIPSNEFMKRIVPLTQIDQSVLWPS
ncbi:MAG: leucyl/phenylalanyl-tRNA--protein transferase, partial [Bradymonadia bacterium]